MALLITSVFKSMTGTQTMGVRQPASLRMPSGDDSSTFLRAREQFMAMLIATKLTLHCSPMS